MSTRVHVHYTCVWAELGLDKYVFSHSSAVNCRRRIHDCRQRALWVPVWCPANINPITAPWKTDQGSRGGLEHAGRDGALVNISMCVCVCVYVCVCVAGGKAFFSAFFLNSFLPEVNIWQHHQAMITVTKWLQIEQLETWCWSMYNQLSVYLNEMEPSPWYMQSCTHSVLKALCVFLLEERQNEHA